MIMHKCEIDIFWSPKKRGGPFPNLWHTRYKRQ